MKNRCQWFVALGLVLGLASGAEAQWNPEDGDTGQWQPPPAEQPPAEQPPAAQPPAGQQGAWGPQGQQPPPSAGSWGTPGGAEAPPSAGSSPNGEGDHAEMSHNVGLTFFGVHSLTLGRPALAIGAPDSAFGLALPTAGLRIWFGTLGLDVGLGFGYRTVTADEWNGATYDITPGSVTDAIGFRLHAGLPIVLQSGAHHAMLIIPEADLGYGSTTFVQNPSDGTFDLTMASLEFDLGARVGMEIHFGFFGVPELSMQLTIGAGLRYRNNSVTNLRPLDSGGIDIKDADFSLSSSITELMDGNIRLTYYFN